MQNDFELENMRQQMAMLKNKLEKQEIVNDGFVRRSMKKEVSSITRYYVILIIMGIFMIPYSYAVFVKLCHFSLAFGITTIIFMIVCTAATYYNKRKISDPDLMSNSLVEARKKIASAKKFDTDWLKIGIPALILWLSWFSFEAYQANFFLFLGGCVGAICGAIGGFIAHRKTQRQYQGIIDQIEDLTAEK